MTAETLLHSPAKADFGGLLGLFRHPLREVTRGLDALIFCCYPLWDRRGILLTLTSFAGGGLFQLAQVDFRGFRISDLDFRTIRNLSEQ
jgi:hypothetical protein